MSYPSPEELLRSLEAEPNQPGVLENTVDALLDHPDVPERPTKVNLRYLKREVLGTSARREDQVELRILQAYVVQVLEDLGVRPPLQRSLRVEIPPPPRFDGGRRKTQLAGYTNVFREWRDAYIPVRTDPVRGPQVENDILIGLQTMYNDAAIAIETGAHVSPPQRVVFDAYDEIIAPVSGDRDRTFGDVLRMLAALDSRLPGGGGGRRKSQTKTFSSCVKAVRKTVKARKGSNPESAAIAICTKSVLFPRGRTIKRYRKGRLLTQKRRI